MENIVYAEKDYWFLPEQIHAEFVNGELYQSDYLNTLSQCLLSDLSCDNEMMKARRNTDYIAMLGKSIAEAEDGGLIVKTIAELETYE